MKHFWESQPWQHYHLRIWFLFFFGTKVTSTGPFMMDIYLVRSELVWIAHCWVWVLEVDKSVLELMSLWVRSFVLGIAKDSCRSNSAHHPLPLFNTLDSFPRTQMPIYFNKVTTRWEGPQSLSYHKYSFSKDGLLYTDSIITVTVKKWYLLAPRSATCMYDPYTSNHTIKRVTAKKRHQFAPRYGTCM